MKTVGLSGGIGSGKSTIAKVFRMLGIPIYYADIEAKRLMHTNNHIIKSLSNKFGSNIYLDGKPNIPLLTEIIFTDSSAREYINSIVHPVVRKDFKEWAILESITSEYVIQESALLFEKDLYRYFDTTITVSAPTEIRAERITERDKISKEFALQKIRSQKSDEERRLLAHFEIINDDITLVIPQVIEIHNSLL